MPKVSIIMPTYNHAEYIAQAIESVLRQTFTDWELIVINNFSTDNTVQIINSYNDQRIRIINFNNEGIIARSRNIGIQSARGSIIAFLDSDDIWLDNKLQYQLAIFDKHKNILAISTAIRLFPNGNRAPLVKGRNRIFSYNELLLRNNIFNSTVLVKKECFQTIGFLEEKPIIKAFEDYEYWLRILLKYNRSIFFLDKELALYRVSSNNQSAYNKTKNAENEITRFTEVYANKVSDQTLILLLAFHRKRINIYNSYLNKQSHFRIIRKVFFALQNQLNFFKYSCVLAHNRKKGK